MGVETPSITKGVMLLNWQVGDGAVQTGQQLRLGLDSSLVWNNYPSKRAIILKIQRNIKQVNDRNPDALEHRYVMFRLSTEGIRFSDQQLIDVVIDDGVNKVCEKDDGIDASQLYLFED